MGFIPVLLFYLLVIVNLVVWTVLTTVAVVKQIHNNQQFCTQTSHAYVTVLRKYIGIINGYRCLEPLQGGHERAEIARLLYYLERLVVFYGEYNLKLDDVTDCLLPTIDKILSTVASHSSSKQDCDGTLNQAVDNLKHAIEFLQRKIDSIRGQMSIDLASHTDVIVWHTEASLL